MSGERGSSGSVARPPESRKRARTGGPMEKPVSYIFICDDDEGLSCHDSGSESARVSRSGSRAAKQNGNLCGEKTSIVVFDGNVGRDGKIGMEIGDVGARRRSAGDGDDDVLLLSTDGCVGFAEGNAGLSNENLVNFGDRYGALVGSLPMKWDISGVDREYKQFLELLRVDGTAYSIELPLLDGLSFVLEYEKGAPCSSSGRPRLQERCGSRKRNGKEGSAAPVLKKCARREHVEAHDDRGPKGRKGKFSDVSTGLKRVSQLGKTRAFEPGTCKPGLQSSKWHVAESVGLPNSQVRDEEMHDDTWLAHLNSLNKDGNQSCGVSTGVKKGSRHVKTRAFEPGTCKLDVQAGKLLVAESARSQKSQVQTESVSDAGQNNQSSSDSDSDVMILDVNPSKSDTPCVVLDGDEEEVKNFSSRSHCPQLKQLLEVLKQPYCKSELLAHMKEFRLRRPLMGHYDLRSGHKLYETEFVGRSYADFHRDLAGQIRTSKEEPKTLNLLRGFFYWLQYSAHGYMDKPWKDPACLSVLPEGAIGATSLFKNEKP